MARNDGMAYRYDLGVKNLEEKKREAAVREAANERKFQSNEAHKNLQEALAAQVARTHEAAATFKATAETIKLQNTEKALNDASRFHAVYSLLKDNDPNRKAQVSELYKAYPNAIKVPAIQKMVDADEKRLAATAKPGLTQEEGKFLKDHGPMGKTDYKALQTAAGDPTAANHEEAAIAYGRVHDLLKKSVGVPTGTPEGISREGYVKGIESTFEKLPNGQPNPAYQPPAGQAPPPSTPAPQNAAAWSNAQIPDIAQPQVPNQPAAAPAAVPAQPTAPNSVQQFLQRAQQSGAFQKTSDAGSAAAAASGRNELNDMLNQSPETQFLTPNPKPTPTPTPPPENKEQFYPA